MSNIYFKKIKIENFMSYEFAEVYLNKPGYIFVRGENRNPEDSASSNGCGKSTIFNAISWVLTGKTTSGVSDVSNIYTTGVTSVELNFESNSSDYKIIRTKNPTNLKIYIDDVNKSGKGVRDSEKLLKEYLPDVTDYLLNSVIILGQGLPQRFTNNTPSGRKEVLELLSKSDFMIDDIKQRLTTRKEILSNNLREKEDNLLKNKNTYELLVSRMNDIDIKLKNLPSEEELNLRICNIKDDLNKLIFDKESVNSGLDKFKNELNDVNEDLLNLQNMQNDDINSIEVEDITDIERLKNETEWELNNKLKEVTRLKSIKDVCPTCGQKLPNVEKIDTTSLEEEIEHLKEDYDSYKIMISKAVSERNDLLSIINKKYSKLKSDLLDRKNYLDNNIYNITNTINQYSNNITLKSNELSSNETELKMLSEQRNSFELEYDNIKNDLMTIEEENIVINTEIDSLKNHLDINSKMSTIVKRDFRGYLLTNVIDFISSRCAYYSKQVFNTENLLFMLDGNNISISYDGKEYEVLSGGEKQKIDVILQLSIRDMLCSYLNFSSNILVLDEITDSLDVVGAQKIFNLISNNLTDVETIYIISHHTDFEIPCDDEIYIVKGDDKISRIV